MAAAVHQRRAVIRLGVGGVAAAALLAACGGDAKPASMLSSPPKEPSAKRAGDLRIAYGAATGDAAGLSDAVYSRLVALDPRTGKVYGDLARSFEVAADGLTVSVQLRDGVHFHPGADNLAASLSADNVRREFSGRRASGDYLFSTAVERIEAPDVRTVVLRMRAPFALLFDYLAETSTGAVRGSARYEAVDVAMGSGPFVPVAREGATTTLVANPLYYRKQLPLLERLQVTEGGGPRDLAGGVGADELDVALHPADVASGQLRLPAGARATTVRRPSRRMRALGFSLVPEKAGGVLTRAVPAFRDARVRRAASVALDRGAIAELDEGTLAGPVGPAHTTDALSADELKKHRLYAHDPLQARQLLDAAGVAELGFALEGANRPQTRAVAQLVEKQLREVGFQPRTRLVPLADWERSFLGGDFEVGLIELDELRTPDLGLRLCMSGGLSGRFSIWGFSSPAFDAAALKALGEVDPRRRGERSRDAQRVLLDEVPPVLPLSAPPDYATVSSELQGFEFDGFEFNTGWNSAVWRLNRKQK